MQDPLFTPQEKIILLRALSREQEFYKTWLEDLETLTADKTAHKVQAADITRARDEVAALLFKVKIMPPHIND